MISLGKNQEGKAFQNENSRILRIDLSDQIWAKAGSMIAYKGAINFEREGVAEHGLGKMFKKALTGEGVPLMKATGKGSLYLADEAKQVHVVELESKGDSITVNGNDILAFERSLDWDINLMRKISGIAAGGLFNVHLAGKGLLAITSHGKPLTIKVTPENPVYTDPHATVAWAGNLNLDFHTDVQLKTFLGRGSGESFQMKFEGEGIIIVQPFEEVYHGEQNY